MHESINSVKNFTGDAVIKSTPNKIKMVVALRQFSFTSHCFQTNGTRSRFLSDKISVK